MVEPWKAAGRMMRDYFAQRGQTWPGFEASDLIRRIKLSEFHHWADRSLVVEAKELLARAFFDVDDLAENFLGFRLDVADLSEWDTESGGPVFGRACPKRKSIIVCKRALEYEPLYRTTVLHEVAHVLLHGRRDNSFVNYSPALTCSSPEEREANQFMQVAILPKPVFTLAVAFVCDDLGIDLRLALGVANTVRGQWIWRNRLFAPMMNLLCVSREFLCVKMSQLRIINPETAQYHKSYALRTNWRTPVAPRAFARILERIVAEMKIVSDDANNVGEQTNHANPKPTPTDPAAPPQVANPRRRPTRHRKRVMRQQPLPLVRAR